MHSAAHVHVHVHAREAAFAARNAAARARIVASLGDGGFLTVASSPHVMWLAYMLARRA